MHPADLIKTEPIKNNVDVLNIIFQAMSLDIVALKNIPYRQGRYSKKIPTGWFNLTKFI